MQTGLFDGFGRGFNAKKGDIVVGGPNLDTVPLAAGSFFYVPSADSSKFGGYDVQPLAFPHIAGTISDTAIGLPGVILTATQSQKPSASTIHYQPFFVEYPITVTEVILNVSIVSSAGGKVRGSMYYMDTSLQPGALISDLGEYDVAAGTGKVSKTGLSITLTRGLYLLALHTDAAATQATFSGWRGISVWTPAPIGKTNWQFIYQYTVGTAYAAAANPGAKWNTVATSSSPFIYYFLMTWTSA